jgi:hypothetical protein
MTIILRPGQRILNIPGIGVSTSRRAVQAAASADWWAVAGKTCIAAYQPKGAADLAASYVNLANPGTYNAALGTAPTHASATGWTFNGTTQCLKTGVNATQVLTILFRHANWGDEFINSYQWKMGPSIGGNQTWVYGSETKYDYSPADGTMGQAGLQAYKDGSASGTPFSSASPNRDLWIGAWSWDNNTVDGAFAAGDILAWAAWADELDATEMAARHTAMAAL